MKKGKEALGEMHFGFKEGGELRCLVALWGGVFRNGAKAACIEEIGSLRLAFERVDYLYHGSPYFV